MPLARGLHRVPAGQRHLDRAARGPAQVARLGGDPVRRHLADAWPASSASSSGALWILVVSVMLALRARPRQTTDRRCRRVPGGARRVTCASRPGRVDQRPTAQPRTSGCAQGAGSLPSSSPGLPAGSAGRSRGWITRSLWRSMIASIERTSSSPSRSARGRGRGASCGRRCSSGPPARRGGWGRSRPRPRGRPRRRSAAPASASSATENCSVNWLKTRNSPGSAGLLGRQLDALQRVADVEEAAGLAALAVDGQRVADHRLHAEAVEHGAEGLVVVEAGDQALVAGGLVGLDPVDDALVEVGRAQAPDPAGEVDVGRVVDLGAVVERAGHASGTAACRCGPCARSRCSPPRCRCRACRTPPSSRA